jgi:hypothetical protein
MVSSTFMKKGEYLGNPAGDGLASDSRARWPLGHKASKTDIARQAGSLMFQETFREIIVEKEEAIAEREERRRKDKGPVWLAPANALPKPAAPIN